MLIARLAALLAAFAFASPGPASSALDETRFQSLLQGFVDQAYLKGFRHLGDERDFDHGHVLHDGEGRPIAILYHTQELAFYQKADSEFGWVNPGARNWIQWIADGKVENAGAYERLSYPRGAIWDWFQMSELPNLKKHRTILDKMLDPDRVKIDPARTKQWVFTKAECGAGRLSVTLPSRERVCLSLQPNG